MKTLPTQIGGWYRATEKKCYGMSMIMELTPCYGIYLHCEEWSEAWTTSRLTSIKAPVMMMMMIHVIIHYLGYV